jgi:hypothetical protein
MTRSLVTGVTFNIYRVLPSSVTKELISKFNSNYVKTGFSLSFVKVSRFSGEGFAVRPGTCKLTEESGMGCCDEELEKHRWGACTDDNVRSSGMWRPEIYRAFEGTRCLAPLVS